MKRIEMAYFNKLKDKPMNGFDFGAPADVVRDESDIILPIPEVSFLHLKTIDEFVVIGGHAIFGRMDIQTGAYNFLLSVCLNT